MANKHKSKVKKWKPFYEIHYIHTARCNTIYVQIYMDAPPGVAGVSKNHINFFTNETVFLLR